MMCENVMFDQRRLRTMKWRCKPNEESKRNNEYCLMCVKKVRTFDFISAALGCSDVWFGSRADERDVSMEWKRKNALKVMK